MTTLLSDASLAWLLLVLAIAAAMVLAGGVRLAAIADELADRTGMGEIIAGAVFVGGSTSLPNLAVGDIIGGNSFEVLSLARRGYLLPRGLDLSRLYTRQHLHARPGDAHERGAAARHAPP